LKAAKITYHRADTLDQALELSRRFNGSGKLMAGGQSLMPMMNLRMTAAEHVIDISGISVLRVSKNLGDRFFIGAGITHSMLEDGKVQDPTRGYLRHVAAGIAYRSIRNRGTVGGSLAHADPAADWPAALLALNATVVIEGNQGERQMPLAEFQRGLMETALAEGELLKGVLVPRLSERARWAYLKFTRKVGEFAHSIAAVVVDPSLKLSSVVLGAVASKPVVLQGVSKNLSPTNIESDLASAGLDSSSYEFQVHKTMITRALAKALQ
jgi:carbon-monoxide dehydrogenase medium subunit